MTSKALRLPAVIERTALSRSSIYRLVQLGRFPEPIKLSERASAWRESDVTAWLESRRPANAIIAGRGAA